VELHEYEDRYATAEVTRDAAGVLTIRMGWRGTPLMWGGRPHQELPELFNAVASDRENRVVILTGTGDTFIGLGDGPNPLAEGRANATVWDRIIWEGNRLVNQMLDIEVPMIAAVNGPVSVHSELAVLCDIVLAADHAYFQDAPHFPGGLVPGDSMQVVWPLLLGPNRGRYFLLTGQQIQAEEAHQLGIVGEVLPADQLMGRALEIAAGLAELNPILLRNARHALVRPLRRAMAEDLHTGLALEAIASMSGREWNRDTGDDRAG
jgi:enoyl-CoA hydratase/carnithine racemase